MARKNPWDDLPEIGEINPKTGKPYKNSKYQRWRTKIAMNRPEVKAKIQTTQSRPEIKARHRAAVKAAHARPETKTKHRAAVKAAYARPEVKAKRRAASKAAHARPETKAKHRAAVIAAVNRPEARKKKKAALADPIIKAKHRAAVKAGTKIAAQRPELKALRLANLKAARARPEVQEKIRKALSSPEVKAKRIAGIKKAYARPEVRRKLSASLKATYAKPEVRARVGAAVSVAKRRLGSHNGREVGEGFLYIFLLPDKSGIMFGITFDEKHRAEQYRAGCKKYRAPSKGEFRGFDWVSPKISNPHDAEQELRESFQIEGAKVDGEVVEAPLESVISRAEEVVRSRELGLDRKRERKKNKKGSARVFDT